MAESRESGLAARVGLTLGRGVRVGALRVRGDVVELVGGSAPGAAASRQGSTPRVEDTASSS